MTMRFQFIVLSAGLVLIGCGGPPPARSGADVSTTAGMTPQQIAAGTVEMFEGKWSLDARVTPPGETKPSPMKMDLDCQRTAGGKAVRCTYVARMAGQPDGEGSILIGYDTYGAKVHFMAMTSDDEVHDHVCTWKDKQNLDCGVLEGGLGGQKVAEELRFRCDGPGSLSFYSNSRFADGKSLLIEAAGKRRESAVARAVSHPGGV
jgi:hypothetical protein